VSEDPTRAIAVRAADCTPILMASRDGRTVAAAHAGWRGTVAGVVTAALREMRVDPGGVVAAIGPAISFESFEVGPEVLQQFTKAFGPEAPLRRASTGKGYVDIRECLRRQLIAAGVPENQIDTTDRCTFRDRDEFYSHRRDKGVTGRMAAMISPRA
jgi:YfiH family protein